MKRIHGLWPKILDRENLRLAATKALRAKRSRFDARQYMSQLDENLLIRWLEQGIRSTMNQNDLYFSLYCEPKEPHSAPSHE